jgi:hypothetical protein
MTDEELRRHFREMNDKFDKPKNNSGVGCLVILFILFLLGFFKGCGYLGN